MAPTPTPKKSAPAEVELEDVVMQPDGRGNFRVVVVKLRGVPVSEKVLEPSVNLPVARQTAVLWRSKVGALHRGLK